MRINLDKNGKFKWKWQCERHTDNNFQHISMWIQAQSERTHHQKCSNEYKTNMKMKWKAILNDFQPVSDGSKTRAAELYCSIVIKRTMERTMLWIVEFVPFAHNIVDNHAQHVVVATAATIASVNAIKVNITAVKSLKRRKQQQKCLWQINRIGEQKRKKNTHLQIRFNKCNGP